VRSRRTRVVEIFFFNVHRLLREEVFTDGVTQRFEVMSPGKGTLMDGGESTVVTLTGLESA